MGWSRWRPGLALSTRPLADCCLRPAPGYQVPGIALGRRGDRAGRGGGHAGRLRTGAAAGAIAGARTRGAHLPVSMIDDLGGHHHSHRDSPVSRLARRAQAGRGAGHHCRHGAGAAPGGGLVRRRGWLLLLTAVLSRIPLFFLKRLAWLSPLILGVALVNALQPAAAGAGWAWPSKSTICLLTIILVSNTTPFSRILRVLKAVARAGLADHHPRAHAPLPVRAGGGSGADAPGARQPDLHAPARARWQALSTVVGQLFVRASERAERIYDAMCARGWK